MRIVSRRARIGLLLGVPFAALLAGSWAVSRALDFPGPDLPSFQDRRATVECFTPPNWILYPACLPGRDDDADIGRTRLYDLGHDFDAAVAAVQRDLQAPGSGGGEKGFRYWTWPEDRETPRRGWGIGLVNRIGGTEIESDHVVLMVNSWRPRTPVDRLSAWIRHSTKK